MNKHSIKLALIYSLTVFIILSLTMMVMGGITMLFFHFGILNRIHNVILFIVFALINIMVGTILSEIIGKKVISSVIEISEATKEIAKGNFTIHLNEEIRAKEIRLMAHNFNIMVKELNNTELLRNDFIENVSHEFKTPLSAIDGYVTLLQDPTLTTEKKELYIEKILSNTKRLSSLTGNILLLSRLDHQEISTQKKDYSLDEQLREVLLLFESEWVSKNLSLDINLDTVRFFGNSELLAQVWQNMIGNAIKFVPMNGNIRIILREDQNFIKVAIVDNGIGLNEEVKKRIYEKFYQGDPSRSIAGNGLGLTLSKHIVELHQGTIDVSSKEGKGTTFVISLPKISPIK